MRQPVAIFLETARYTVRSLDPSDDMGGWGTWLADPGTAAMLNARPATLTQEQFRQYVQGFDRINNHLLGIFERDSGRLIGVRAYYIDWPHRDVLINILIGDNEARHKGALTETTEPTLRYFFEELDLSSMRCTVVAGNEPILHILARVGYVLEHRDMKAAASGQGVVELLHFRLTRDEWRRRQAL